MESVLWALNLCAVVYLCFWAIKEDNKFLDKEKTDKESREDEVEQ